MENKMERTNLHYQDRWLSLHQTPRESIAPSFFSSGWESLFLTTAQYRKPYLDTPANNRPTYYIDILGFYKKLYASYTSLRGFMSRRKQIHQNVFVSSRTSSMRGEISIDRKS